jgi:hypothetical protein
MLGLFAEVASLVLIGFFFFEVSWKGKLILLAVLLLSFFLPVWIPLIGTNGFPMEVVGSTIRIFLAICYLIKRKISEAI